MVLLAAPPKTRFLLLEKALLTLVREAAPELCQKFLSLPHPLPASAAHWATPVPAPLNRSGQARAIRVAFIGNATKKKGFVEFVALAQAITTRLAGKIEFHAIGALSKDSAGLDLRHLAVLPSEKKLSRKKFLEALAGIDYICMPYCQTAYRYRASGTLLDAAAAGKPVLALITPTLEALQSQFGDFGLLANTLGQLQSELEALVMKPAPERYGVQVGVMRVILKSRMPSSLAAEWQDSVICASG